MALTAWAFPTVDGAEKAVEHVQQLQKQDLIKLQDAAMVSWPVDKKKPKTHHLSHLSGPGALGGSFWGMLFGLLFFAPLLGAAIGAGVGALTWSLGDAGVDDDFVQAVKESVTPGTSALFLLTTDARMDQIKDVFSGLGPQLITSDLASDQEAKLREIFTED